MTLLTRGTRHRRFKNAAFLAGIGVALALGFHFLRARRLLSRAGEIATYSARFPRDYQVGNGPKITYLVMGDSTAAGWGASDWKTTYPHQIASALAARGFRVHVVNVAVGGATLEQVEHDQSPFLNSVKPDIISLSVGANDATRGTSSAVFGRELQSFFVDLAVSSAQIVLVANVPDMFLAPALPFPFSGAVGKRARALNATLEALPAPPKIRIVDLHRRGKLDYRRDAGLYAADLFHPSGRGYAVWSKVFIEEMERAAPLLTPAQMKQR